MHCQTIFSKWKTGDACLVQGSGELHERSAFVKGLVDVALWALEPTIVCASRSPANASDGNESQCSGSDLDIGEDGITSNHALMASVCQHYNELFRT